MERRAQLLQYTAVDREFFEPYASRPIRDDDFMAPARRVLPEPWTMERSGIWVHCRPPDAVLPMQGWKIHISSISSTATIVLSIAAATLGGSGTPFKFAADQGILGAINGKRWPRSGSGKFITVYPRDVADFRQVIADLHAALSGYAGPYVLTDRRYEDSRVLHYRYGGIVSDFRVSPGGRREWLLRRPDDATEVDDRSPRFKLPDWLRDPFGAESPAEPPSSVLLGGGRYRVYKALAFSSAGGVYLADDLDAGQRVVIKEARPFIGFRETAKESLRKEYRLLRRLASLHVAPQPVAYFEEWEHSFLVEEYLRGETMRLWLGRRYPWLKTRATRDDVAQFLADVVAIFSDLADAIARVHAVGVSLGDLSFHNIIVNADGGVRLIDLEAAVEEGLDTPLPLRTPGFASGNPSPASHAEAKNEDGYAFGANLLAAMIPVNAMLPLDRGVALRFARWMSDDLGYPSAVTEAIAQLLNPDTRERPLPTAVMATLRTSLACVESGEAPVPYRDAAVPPPPARQADALFAYVTAQAARARPDRFVPAAPEVFESHPWGVAHGAAGVLHAYLRGRRAPPEGLREYLFAGVDQGGQRGSSLMSGDAGIAWVLFEAGEADRAAALMRAAPLDDGLRRCPGLYEGLAGWGLARIKAWHETADADFLATAVKAGDLLLGSAISGDDGALRWPDGDQQPIGLAYGAAGIALFLLHLNVATGERRFLEGAIAGLAFDLAQRRLNPDGAATWPMSLGPFPSVPYLRQGTAGIVAVVARFHAVTGDARYADMLLASEGDLLRQHAISPGLFDGLAGIGETLLDLARFLPARATYFRHAALRVAHGIRPFLIRRDEGLAVPGTELLRISCDLATGGLGVASFFDRLRHGAPAAFMLDELLPSNVRQSRNLASTR
ncbi:MAG TPA: class III lanthionine synthetase LanKC [Luteibacter sp.]|uniref:class III lanthionine synthetase LanKC n=1 Tax=Luteibacter sp. TaxID=1886636 RepID=UPI002CB16770|nr:class III lanthionine synthetase LanKC [Luteibacter sp.]HVI56714.1 class III lanthionine synthetase LanKC [Luteibacter sp.]